MEKSKKSISVKSIPKKAVEKEIDCSAGLSSQGIVNVIPTNPNTYKFVHMGPGLKLSPKAEKLLIKNIDAISHNLNTKDRKKLEACVRKLKKKYS